MLSLHFFYFHVFKYETGGWSPISTIVVVVFVFSVAAAAMYTAAMLVYLFSLIGDLVGCENFA